jgi:hypothetical protein
MRVTVFPLPQWSRWRRWTRFPRDCFVSQGEKQMRALVFGIALSTATIFASSSFAAWAVCATGYKAEPKMINGSEDYGQSYTCKGTKAASELVCSTNFTAQSAMGGMTKTSSTPTDDQSVYTCAQPATPSK